jgi:hypothetical protein
MCVLTFLQSLVETIPGVEITHVDHPVLGLCAEMLVEKCRAAASDLQDLFGCSFHNFVATKEPSHRSGKSYSGYRAFSFIKSSHVAYRNIGATP